MKRREITDWPRDNTLYYLIASEILCITIILVTPYSSSALGIPQDDILTTFNDTTKEQQDLSMGAWMPSNASFIIEDLNGADQISAIALLLDKGYEEYYFVMTDLDPKSVSLTDKLLSSADTTDLKIRIILLPPSEGGPNGNYDWNRWIEYFNSLKKHHKSFDGFTIDDFNWISTRNDTRFEYNIDFMEYSNLREALKEKREGVKFLPTIYFEGKRTNIAVGNYSDLIDGVLLVSGCYYDISALEEQIHIFDTLFDNKPNRYIVYPTITHNYSRYNYNPPSDSQVISTLSIASNMADGLIVWHDMDNPVIQEFLDNKNNTDYVSTIEEFENVMVAEERIEAKLNSLTERSQSKKDINCKNWHDRYVDAYNRWFGQGAKDGEKWENEMMDFLQIS